MTKCKLGDILDVKRGASLSGKYYSTKGSLIRLTLGNFNYPNGGFKENTSKFDIFFIGEVKKEFILKEGDIITPLTEQVAGLLGETARIPESGKYIQSGDIGLIIPNEEKLNKSFAYYLVSSPHIKKQLGAGAQQTKIRHTSPDKIKACETWIPDLKYQEKVGYILDNINSKINYNNKINQELEQMAKTIYDYWFLQFDFPDENGNPYKTSGGEMVWNDILKKEIPENWIVKNISDIADITWGQCPEGKNILPLNTNEKDVIDYCSGAGDMKNGFVVNCQAKTNASKRFANENDILVSVAGKIGDMCVVDHKISLGRAAMAYSVHRREDLMYLFLSLEMLNKKIITISSGSIQKVLNSNHIKDLNIVYNEEIINKYSKIGNEIFEKLKYLSKENEELKKLRDFLLPLLINGQVKL